VSGDPAELKLGSQAKSVLRFEKESPMSANTLIELAAVVIEPRLRGPSSVDAPGAATTLNRIGGIAALAVVALIPIQAAIFILWPPPTTVLGYFSVFQTNLLLGLLDLDFLLIVDQLLIVLVLLALYVVLKHADESLMLVATTLGIVGAVLFIVSREATVSMIWLSQQYAGASSDADRSAVVAAGQTLLTVYNGTAFSVGYFLSATMVISVVMLRSRVFSRTAGVAGVLGGVTGLVPASFGTLGFVLSFISLPPLLVWLALIGRRLLRLRSDARTESRLTS
jgi:Domain of unknown function (DUF4386)